MSYEELKDFNSTPNETIGRTIFNTVLRFREYCLREDKKMECRHIHLGKILGISVSLQLLYVKKELGNEQNTIPATHETEG